MCIENASKHTKYEGISKNVIGKNIKYNKRFQNFISCNENVITLGLKSQLMFKFIEKT